MLFYVPIAYGKHLFDKIRGIEEPKPREQNVWKNHIEFDTHSWVFQKFYNVESHSVEYLLQRNKSMCNLLSPDLVGFRIYQFTPLLLACSA